MENAIIAGLSSQMALMRQMEVVSNNIANMSTPGYHAQNMVFQEYISNKQGPRVPDKDPLSLVSTYGQFQDLSQGALEQTGNTLDLAIQGRAYFGVQTEDGIRFTRAGNFSINQLGELVNNQGLKVAGTGGGNITIPEDAIEIKVDENGVISDLRGEYGQIMVVEFEKEQELSPEGSGLYSAPNEGQPAVNSRVMQGFLEGSNVQPILEMTRMIDVSRAYQRTANLIQGEHDRQRSMIQRLTRPA